MPLNDVMCRNAKATSKPKKISDGGGLYLLVQVNGSKLWRMNYRFEQKQKTLSFGAYPRIGVAKARTLRTRAKEALAAGRDPAKVGITVGDPAAANTFEKIALDWHRAQEKLWVPSHALRVMRRLEMNVFPKIGRRPIDDLESPEILEVVRAVEERGAHDVARRVRRSMSAVFRYAIASGLATRDPAEAVTDAMMAAPKVQHRTRIQGKELPDFLTALHSYDGHPQTALAIELVLHTFVRTNEIRFARWSEFDGDVWRIPGERMKMGLDHIVPLSKQSKRILKELKKISGASELVVPAQYGRPMSQNTMIFALYRMGFHGRATVHGLRGFASTMLNESGLWHFDAIERQLAHVERNKVRGAYNAAEYLPERRRMMQWWSDYITAAETS